MVLTNDVANFPGYIAKYDDDNNLIGYLDVSTGELVSPVYQPAPSGTDYVTPADRRRRKRYTSIQKPTRGSGQESFYFALAEHGIDIKPASLARLFLLATYLRWGTNDLYFTERRRMVKDDLGNALGISPEAVRLFLREVLGIYLYEDQDGYLTLCDIFVRGKLGLNKLRSAGESGYQKVFCATYRSLYRATPKEKHCYLGYLLLLLEWLSWEYNMVVWNPSVTTVDDLYPMTLAELCDKIGYDAHNKIRLVKELDKLTFPTKDGDNQRLIAWLTDEVNGLDYLVVNPRVIYRGSDYKKVESLGVFFNR